MPSPGVQVVREVRRPSREFSTSNSLGELKWFRAERSGERSRQKWSLAWGSVPLRHLPSPPRLLLTAVLARFSIASRVLVSSASGSPLPVPTVKLGLRWRSKHFSSARLHRSRSRYEQPVAFVLPFCLDALPGPQEGTAWRADGCPAPGSQSHLATEAGNCRAKQKGSGIQGLRLNVHFPMHYLFLSASDRQKEPAHDGRACPAESLSALGSLSASSGWTPFKFCPGPRSLVSLFSCQCFLIARAVLTGSSGLFQPGLPNELPETHECAKPWSDQSQGRSCSAAAGNVFRRMNFGPQA
jgi:hypothetical protein